MQIHYRLHHELMPGMRTRELPRAIRFCDRVLVKKHDGIAAGQPRSIEEQITEEVPRGHASICQTVSSRTSPPRLRVSFSVNPQNGGAILEPATPRVASMSKTSTCSVSPDSSSTCVSKRGQSRRGPHSS